MYIQDGHSRRDILESFLEYFHCQLLTGVSTRPATGVKVSSRTITEPEFHLDMTVFPLTSQTIVLAMARHTEFTFLLFIMFFYVYYMYE